MTELTTDEIIARIEELDAAATEGPWECQRWTEECEYDGNWQFTFRVGIKQSSKAVAHAPLEEVNQLIAEYRSLAPELARRVKALQEENKYLRGQRLSLGYGLCAECGEHPGIEDSDE